jgi:chromate transporter
MMREEVVRKKKWQEHFLDLIGATNLIPGPNSTEMAIHIGHERAVEGTNCRRLLFHSSCGIITGIFAWLYKDYGQPAINLFYGIKPAIIAILGAIFPLAKKSLKTVQLGIIGGIVLLLALLQFNEIILLLAPDS